MKLARLLMAFALGLTGFLKVSASDVKIIANPSVKGDSISLAELQGVFLLTRSRLKDGSQAVPVLEKDGQTHEEFLKQYLKRDSDEIRTYYQSLVFTGKGSSPKEFKSEDEVVPYVARTRGAIAYVSNQANIEGVKVLFVTDGHTEERTIVSRVDPDYPETLQRLGIGGTVRLAVIISSKGSVENVALLGGNPILAEAASKAVKQWIYAPGPNRTTVEVTVPFESHH